MKAVAEPTESWLAWVVRRWAGRILAVPALVLTLLAIGDPLAHAAGADVLATVFHTILDPFCHQLPERSLAVAGFPMGLCARCFAIYASLATALLLIPARGSLAERLPEIPVWVVLVALLPLAVDGTTQLIGWRHSTNLLRVLTGALLGLGAGLYVAVAVGRASREPAADS